MKNTILLLSVILGGCSLLPSKYDSSFYDHLATLSVDVDQAVPKCGTPEESAAVAEINRESKILLRYTQYPDLDLNGPMTLTDKAITQLQAAYSIGTPSKHTASSSSK